jgi:putative ABC transport system permease protein
MDDVVLASLGDRLFQTRVLGVFAVLAMLLAAVGVYGVTAYSVSERTQEVGIRMALGARADQVARMTLGQVLRLVVPGLLVGTGAALATTRLIAASLYEVAPGDPVTSVAVALLLGAVAIAAAIVPTRRATRINPVEVLSG